MSKERALVNNKLLLREALWRAGSMWSQQDASSSSTLADVGSPSRGLRCKEICNLSTQTPDQNGLSPVRSMPGPLSAEEPADTVHSAKRGSV